MAMSALEREHEAWFIGADELSCDADGKIRAWATTVEPKRYKSPEVFLALLKSEKARRERIVVDELDVLMLRINPAATATTRPWSATTALMFARAVTRSGTIVLNDPRGLQTAMNKLYFQLFPPEVVPKTVITRDRDAIREFLRQEGKIVLKPLQGSGGQNVFMANHQDQANLNQMIDAVSRDGYVIAQEYLPEASEGDTRVFMLNGKPLRYKGHYAAVRRECGAGDIRSNCHVGGTPAPAKLTEEQLDVARIVGPKLAQDGMFLVGLDLIGPRIIEINVFTPGGLGSARKFEGVNFYSAITEDLEKKVRAAQLYGRDFTNNQIATL